MPKVVWKGSSLSIMVCTFDCNCFAAGDVAGDKDDDDNSANDDRVCFDLNLICF